MSFSSSFSSGGLDDTSSSLSWSYLYGMSDFWASTFQDSAKIDALLDANAQVCSDVYSELLQLLSTVSLEQVQTEVGFQTKLVLLKDSDALSGNWAYSYTLPDNITNTDFIANRPILPTVVLENGVDYTVDTSTGTILFAKDPWSLGFSSRALSTGERQLAMWFMNCKVDKSLVYKYYASLIGIGNEVSTELFKNFVYGMFYLYSHGPNLGLLRKGLNLVIGIPVARSEETVLDIRQHTDIQDWIVVTDTNEYIIPYGLEPTVAVGDTLSVMQELASWVEVKDYVHDGDWWINLQIPSSIIPNLPSGSTSRYASAGSYCDELMRKYLKTHTFLVRVNVTAFKDVQFFTSISEILQNTKPTYARPLYIWAVPIDPEVIDLRDSNVGMTLNSHRCDLVFRNSHSFVRDSETPYDMGCPRFIRCNVPAPIDRLVNMEEPIPRIIEGGDIYGYINPNSQYRPNTLYEVGWLRTLVTRGNETVRINKGDVYFHPSDVEDASFDGSVNVGVETYLPDMRKIPLYTTTYPDMVDKLLELGRALPPYWHFSIGLDSLGDNGQVNGDAIGGSGINSGPQASHTVLVDKYDLLFFRGYKGNYLGHVTPPEGYRTYAPDVSLINLEDYLLCVRISDITIGVYWVTSNQSESIPGYFVIEDSESLSMDLTAPISMGLGGSTDCTYYLIRGETSITTGTGDAVINNRALNETLFTPGSTNNYYRGNVMVHGGVTLPHSISSGPTQ